MGRCVSVACFEWSKVSIYTNYIPEADWDPHLPEEERHGNHLVVQGNPTSSIYLGYGAQAQQRAHRSIKRKANPLPFGVKVSTRKRRTTRAGGDLAVPAANPDDDPCDNPSEDEQADDPETVMNQLLAESFGCPENFKFSVAGFSFYYILKLVWMTHLAFCFFGLCTLTLLPYITLWLSTKD